MCTIRGKRALASLGQHLKALEADRAHENRRAFVDGDRNRDGLLVGIEVGVDRGDLRVGIAAIGVERLDALRDPS